MLAYTCLAEARWMYNGSLEGSVGEFKHHTE